MAFDRFPAARLAWPGRMREAAEAAGPMVATTFTAVILGVSSLRLIGFTSTVFTLKYPVAALAQYIAVGGTIVSCLYYISRGLIIEPPVFLTTAVAGINQWVARRIGTVAGAAQ